MAAGGGDQLAAGRAKVDAALAGGQREPAAGAPNGSVWFDGAAAGFASVGPVADSIGPGWTSAGAGAGWALRAGGNHWRPIGRRRIGHQLAD